ncbi:hypothetical protein ADU59_06185 [Pararhizobium polonicum]|uniref:Uncharacterized protein n=1 Tax=Pararhizobium polonicum TaxID=1612624 RepID=A0A1C7P448_9HYPH|nr:hypothetical protein [Pararhizobium polonicum]OBZ95977.1 hypothetical protein ADU59_06185 [Pararhizobium polonicum]
MNIDDIFWSQLDPLYHLKQASCIYYADNLDQHFKVGGLASKDTDFGEDFLEGMKEMKASALRFIRFHAAETLLTALLGSYPHGPVPRFARIYFGPRFNGAVESVARQEIPAELPLKGVTDFGEWLSQKFWVYGSASEPLSEDVVKFVRVQSSLLANKTVYNAFKHGCRIGSSWPTMSMKDEKTGEWLPFLDIKSGVGWLHWDEKRGRKTSISFGAMECNPADDHGAIAIMALLVRAMKKLRLAKKGESVTVNLPNNIQAGLHVPANMNVNMTLS